MSLKAIRACLLSTLGFSKVAAPWSVETKKVSSTAVVVIPDDDVWEPIQAIRRKHDRNVHRWMPHVTMLYPFLPPEEFDALTGPMATVCDQIEPFEVTLGRFRWFRNSSHSYTLWLAPEAEELDRLQEALWQVVPECDDTRNHPGGFTAHLSIGQARTSVEVHDLVDELQASWRPLRFVVDRISLIRRNAPPDDMFRVDQEIRLG